MTHILSANRLSDGRIIFLGAHDWVDDFAQARLLENTSAISAAETHGQEAVKQNLIIDPVMVALDDNPKNPTAPKLPKTLRDKIRCLGPSILGPSILQSLVAEPALDPAHNLSQNLENGIGTHAKKGDAHVSL